MKKVVSLIAAAAMFAAVSGAAITADNNPAVYVDGREIFFDDQAAVIKDDRTLVPARGVFEAMGAKVEWDGEKRQVQVTSADEQTIVRLVIDDADMKVYDMSGLFAALMSGQDFHAPETVVTLDVPAQIMNDRTMVPLRAISEAVNANVEWYSEAYMVDITTKNAPTVKTYEDKPSYLLSSNVTTAKEGETIDLYIDVKNLPKDTYVSSVTAGINYNPENFEYVTASLVNGDNEIPAAVNAANPEFSKGCLKVLYATIDSDAAVTTDGKVLKITFKSLNGKQGIFTISNGYNTELYYNTVLGVYSEQKEKDIEYDGNNLFIDTTPVIVNAADAEATAEPEATTVPEATEAPEATTEPEATTAPEATAEPTAAPEA